MMTFASRCLPVSVFLLLLAGCQYEVKPYHGTMDSSVSGYRQVEQSLAAGHLEQAARELHIQQAQNPRDTRGHSLQLQLAEAYLSQGQRALQQNDLGSAKHALEQANHLLPEDHRASQALSNAITEKQHALQQAAERAREEAERLAAQQQAQLLARQRATQLAAETALAGQPAVAPTPPAPRQPRLINPQAPSSSIELPMLEHKDNEALRSLLDAVAHDVVAYNCAVRIEVREAKDFPWTAALLSARIKRLDPHFEPSVVQSIRPDQVPRLVLTPVR